MSLFQQTSSLWGMGEFFSSSDRTNGNEKNSEQWGEIKDLNKAAMDCKTTFCDVRNLRNENILDNCQFIFCGTIEQQDSFVPSITRADNHDCSTEEREIEEINQRRQIGREKREKGGEGMGGKERRGEGKSVRHIVMILESLYIILNRR